MKMLMVKREKWSNGQVMKKTGERCEEGIKSEMGINVGKK